MNLDKRIINGKRPLTCFDVEEAKKYIGKLCYMCDEYNLFYQLNLIEPAILMGVEDCEIPFHYGRDYQAEFCLPCDWITKEKKYRPYTIVEFCLIFKIGQPIRFRNKETKCDKFVIFSGYELLKDGWSVMMGNYDFTLEHLFNKYEWQKHDTENYTEDYQPFGVEE